MAEDLSKEELAAQLDKDLDDFIQDKIDNPSGEAMDMSFLDMDPETFAKELKQHPAFMTEFDETKPLSPAMQGLQALKYETDSAEFNATSYKEDGNANFKRKSYRWAIDNYTAGIKLRPADRLLNAVLYTNRAASHFRIGNFRSALNDVIYAKKFKPDHTKALFRGAQCCLELEKYDACIKWCDDGLLLNEGDEKLLEIRSSAGIRKKKQMKEQRKRLARERKKAAEEQKLIETIKDRGVNLEMSVSEDGEKMSVLKSIEAHHPSGAQVHLGGDGTLNWPVYFMYPEFGESDFIGSFNENTTFSDHIEAMFGSSVGPPGWDQGRKYKPSSIKVFFEEQEKQKLHEVKKGDTLSKVLKRKVFKVRGGTPSFILLVDGDAFAKDFFSKYR